MLRKVNKTDQLPRLMTVVASYSGPPGVSCKSSGGANG